MRYSAKENAEKPRDTKMTMRHKHYKNARFKTQKGKINNIQKQLH